MGLMSQLNVDANELDEALAGVHEEFGVWMADEFGTNPALDEDDFVQRAEKLNLERIDKQFGVVREAGWIPPTITDLAVRRLRQLDKRLVGADAREVLLSVIALLES